MMRARLTIEAGAASPQVWDLQSDQTVRLGRNRSNTIVVQDEHVSRFHAEVFASEDRWFVRDCGTTNGTRLNGIRITEPASLEHNHVITIGDVRLRFTLDPSKEGTAKMAALPALLSAIDTPSPNPAAELSTTVLHADELTALFNFMTASLKETTLHGLVTLALTAAYKQTLATTAGFLSLDGDDPTFRIVLPAQAQVNHQLSRQLTQTVLREDRTIWLGAARGRELESESLLAFRDAVCIPLRAAQDPGTAPAPLAALGALHVYKSNRLFTEREVRFLEVLAGCLASTLYSLRSRRALEADNTRLHKQGGCASDILIGDSPVMQQLRQQIAKFAGMPCTVLITGESGVGKELVALSLHRHSPRREGPLVPVNCAAIPASIAEAELFGHEEGAYTGATRDRPGYFLRADEGTLFLDEIGEMSLNDQAKLLRVLETKTLCRVGGDVEVKVDVRVVAATNRDLEREVREGHFRKDLFFRLGARIHVPPLRDHLEDIPALVEHFLARLTVEYRRRVRLSASALERLQTYTWPGNVRQLRSVLETAVAMTEGDTIHAGDLGLMDELGRREDQGGDQPTSLNLEELEAWAIRQALAQTQGNNSQAARLLGIHRDTLLNKLKKYRIEK
jgi:two-component system response regulator HydG